MKKIFRKIWEEFLDTVFPIECIGCKRNFEELPQKERWICPECLLKINLRSEQVCPVCEKISEGGKTHVACRDKTTLDGLWAAVYYEDLVEKAVHSFKFNFIQDFSKILSNFMIVSVRDSQEFGDFHEILMSAAGKEVEESIYMNDSKKIKPKTLILPVPLHRKRYNWRGFNQSELLSKNIAEAFGVEMRNDILFRKKNTRPQSKIDNETERRENIKGAFICSEGDGIVGAYVIIVDDVCTTLSTLNECALEVKRAGAKKVWALVVARR